MKGHGKLPCFLCLKYAPADIYEPTFHPLSSAFPVQDVNDRGSPQLPICLFTVSTTPCSSVF